MKISKIHNRGSSDQLGIALSILCLIHCLVLPPVLAMLPLILPASLPAWLHESEWFHAALLAPVLLISGPALAAGGKIDRSIWILALVAFGLLSLALAIEPARWERLLTISGALLLVVAHLKNRRFKNMSC